MSGDTRSQKLSKEKFIRELLNGRGINEICRDHGYKSASVYYRWKKQDTKFAEEAEKILASPLHAQRIAAAQSPKLDPLTWREQYINKYRETRNRTVAADFVGKTITFVINASDPSHDDFDEEFYTMIREQELRDAVTVEDELLRKSVVENSVQMQKWILPYLPVVGEKYYRGAENRLKVKEGDNNTVIFFSPDGIQSGKKLLESMFGSDEKEIVY
jgi:transposase-like protein